MEKHGGDANQMHSTVYFPNASQASSSSCTGRLALALANTLEDSNYIESSAGAIYSSLL